MTRDSNQLTLSLFDTTSLSSGLTLDGGSYGAALIFRHHDEDVDDTAATPPVVRAHNFILRGDRQLAQSWKQRAIDNVAAIRLSIEIDDAKRNATPEEQEILCPLRRLRRRDLADKMFRRAGEILRRRAGKISAKN